MSEKGKAFAEVLYQLARKQPSMSATAMNYVQRAEEGAYADKNTMPAWTYEPFGITEQEYKALWLLVYG